MKKYAGEEFLNRLYKDLVHSAEVKHTAKGANKNEDLAIYLERLERITKEARDKDRLELLKYFYYKKYIIKEENIPDSYFEHQEQLALERGYGHIIYNEHTKKQEINLIINNQKESLSRWLNYFFSEETNYYPMWLKYYVFQNIIKIGYFDKEKNEFTKRTSSTVKPFIEINREAIAMLYDFLYKYLDNQQITDEILEKLIKNGSFPKIYAYIIKKLDESKKITSTSNEGIWKKYNQRSNPEILFHDIHGKGTGWCTAGGLETAKTHLNSGDFHVYYTKDENGEYIIPRIAIRMEYEKIAEIRGVAEHQNIESEMESVVEEKLQEFPDKDKYKKKVSDMKLLAKIYKKNNNEEVLTKEELIFLYEINSKIIGFGYDDDPRIKEIIRKRNIRKDLAYALDISENEISLTDDEYVKGNIKCHYGNLNLTPYLMETNPTFPELVIGDFSIECLEEAKKVLLPRVIQGDLNLSCLDTVDELIMPEIIYGSIDLRYLTKARKIVFPKEVGGDLDLAFLKNINEMSLPTIVGGYLNLRSLTCAKKVELPEEVGDTLYLEYLEEVGDFKWPKVIQGDLELSSLKKANGLILPNIIEGNLYLSFLNDLQGIILPKNDQGKFYVPGSELYCEFSRDDLIKAAKWTERKQKVINNNLVKKLVKKIDKK